MCTPRVVKTKGPIVNPEKNIDLSNVVILDCGNSFEYDFSAISESSKLNPFDKLSPVSDDTAPRVPVVISHSERKAYSLEMAHQLHAARVKEALERGYYVFSIGGSNDQSFPNALALMELVGAKNTAVVNIDAHLDVRPLVDPPAQTPADPHTHTYSPLPSFTGDKGVAHSGSPFRQLLQYPGFQGSSFAEFACQGSQCSAEHANFARGAGGELHWLSEIQKEGKTAEAFRNLLVKLSGDEKVVFVSFDIDSVAGSDAPGVSCPGSVGLSAQEAVDMSFIAGQQKSVKLFDLSELCPTVEGYRTPLLATFMFYNWLLGIASSKL